MDAKNFFQRRDAATSVDQGSEQSPYGLVPEARHDAAYNEETFRYFLSAERERSSRSNRPFLLMLVEFAREPENGSRIEPRVAGRLFAALTQSLRETDFVGWYHHQRVAGAVLTQLEDTPDTDVSSVVVERVTRALQENVRGHLRDRLQVRVYEIPASQKVRS